MDDEKHGHVVLTVGSEPNKDLRTLVLYYHLTPMGEEITQIAERLHQQTKDVKDKDTLLAAGRRYLEEATAVAQKYDVPKDKIPRMITALLDPRFAIDLGIVTDEVLRFAEEERQARIEGKWVNDPQYQTLLAQTKDVAQGLLDLRKKYETQEASIIPKEQ